MRPTLVAGLAALVLATGAAAPAQTEFHLQYGEHRNPFSAAGHPTLVITVQQASGWKLGDSFYFIDYLADGEEDGFNDRDFYGEWYPTLSLGKLSGRAPRFGPVTDLALIAGVNAGGDAGVVKYLPGLRVSWKVPGFLFLNTDLTAYIDANTGVAGGGAPATGNGFLFDVSWVLPFEAGGQSLSMAGHAEYLSGTTDELGHDVKGSILAQPQLTWDLGGALFGTPHQLMAGIEYQYWRNKLGTELDESIAQWLLVWRL